jgi:hypothetical protein
MTTACAVALAGGFKKSSVAAMTPDQFDNVVLWLRSSDNVSGDSWVEIVTGEIGFFGGPITENENVFGTRPGISFSGALLAEAPNSALDCLHDGSGVTVLALVKPGGSHSSGTGYIFGTDIAGDLNSIGASLRHFTAGTGRPRYVAANGTGSAAIDLYGSTIATPNAAQILRARFRASDTPDCALFVNGVEATPTIGTDTAAAVSAAEGGTASVGASSDGSLPYSGTIGEIVVIAGVPTAGELAGYLAYVNDYFGQAFAGA